MKLSQLRYLSAIWEYGSFSKAAEYLYISQPAISIAIRDLENEYGITLLERNRGRVEFTSAGQMVVNEARVILGQVDHLAERMERLSHGIMEIRLGVTPAMSSLVVPLLLEPLKAFNAQYPHACARLTEWRYDMTLDAMRHGVLDFIFGNIFDSPDDMRVWRMVQAPISACVGKSHPLARLKKASFSDVEKERLLTFFPDSTKLNEAISKWFHRHKGKPNFIYYSQKEVVERLVEQGKGIALMAHPIHSRNARIIPVPLDEEIMVGYGLFCLKTMNLSDEMKALIQCAERVFRNLVV